MKHLEDYRAIHRQRADYGPGPGGASLEVFKLLLPAHVSRVIDYGCGNSRALDALWPGSTVERCYYDPAMPGRDVEPTGRYDAGLCTDVLEHVPEDELPALLDRLATLAPAWGFIIHTGPAGQKLPDGSNAHVTQRRMHWWLRLLFMRFGEPVVVLRINRWRFLVVTGGVGESCGLMALAKN